MIEINTAQVLSDLRQDGFAVSQDAIDPALCAEMADTFDGLETDLRANGNLTEKEGSHVVVFSPYLYQPKIFLPWIDHEPFLNVVNEMLDNDHVVLNGSAGSRSTGPDAGAPHKDGMLAVHDIRDTTDVQVAICLDDFTEETGATHFWKGTHETGVDPKNVENIWERPERVVAEAPRGSVVFFLGSTWHAMGANKTGQRRWGYFLQYSRWFVKPMFEHHTMGEELYGQLSTKQRELFGFSSRPPRKPGGRVLTVTDPNALPDSYEDAMAI